MENGLDTAPIEEVADKVASACLGLIEPHADMTENSGCDIAVAARLLKAFRNQMHERRNLAPRGAE